MDPAEPVGAPPAQHPADHPGPLVFVDDLATPVLAEADRHHLDRVLRLRVGDPLTVADGTGRWCTGVFTLDLEITGPVLTPPAPEPALAIGFALVKGDRPELIVQKLTELGIDRIVPFHAERSVVRWDGAKAAKAVTRLRTVARAAAMQCHRPRLPRVEELTSFAELASAPGVARAERGGPPPTRAHRTVLIGPEGGWAPAEEELGIPIVAFGQNVLRAETAAITAGVVITALRSGIVEPMGPYVT